jgi:hypothetical protein
MAAAPYRIRETWVVFATALALAAALGVPQPARAGLLDTGAASYCDATPYQPFKPWGDSATYALTPGGTFEPGTPSWSLHGASVVAGNETSYVHGKSDRRSLYLPSGSYAVSPTTCFALGDWHLRFFVKNVGAASGRLNVSVVVPSLVGGLLTVLDGGSISADGTWRPSPRLELLLCNVTSLVGTRAVAFRLTPVGYGAAFQVDDVYLDPWVSV